MAKPMTAPVANSVATGPRSSAMWRCQSESSWPEMLGCGRCRSSRWLSRSAISADRRARGLEQRPELLAEPHERRDVAGVDPVGHPRPGAQEPADAVEGGQRVGAVDLVGFGRDQVDTEVRVRLEIHLRPLRMACDTVRVKGQCCTLQPRRLD